MGFSIHAGRSRKSAKEDCAAQDGPTENGIAETGATETA